MGLTSSDHVWTILKHQKSWESWDWTQASHTSQTSQGSTVIPSSRLQVTHFLTPFLDDIVADLPTSIRAGVVLQQLGASAGMLDGHSHLWAAVWVYECLWPLRSGMLHRSDSSSQHRDAPGTCELRDRNVHLPAIFMCSRAMSSFCYQSRGRLPAALMVAGCSFSSFFYLFLLHGFVVYPCLPTIWQFSWRKVKVKDENKKIITSYFLMIYIYIYIL